MLVIRTLFILFLIVFSWFANAEKLTIPVQASAIKSELHPIGKATFTVLFFDIYHASLYSTSKQYDDCQSQCLFEINYLKGISAEGLIEKTVEQWQHLSYPEYEYQHYLEVLTKLWPDIESGDTLSMWVNNQISYFYFNDKYLGKVEATKFADKFLSIWLSPNTSQPGLRKKLLSE